MTIKPTATEIVGRLERLTEPAEQQKLQSDGELLELYVLNGSPAAIEALVRRHSAMVASVCAMTVAEPSSAEDAFQATFLILLKSAKKIRRTSSLAAWLHGVAYRCACRVRKLARKTPPTQSVVDVIGPYDSRQDPISVLARTMELEALHRELEKLPEHLRAPLVEHYLLGLTAPQIAQRMELSTSAVEGRLRRGRQALRTKLAQRGISLSVLVAGSGLFQEHLAASESGLWGEQFVERYLPQNQTLNSHSQTSHSQPLTSPSPQVSSLVRGEISMIGTSTFKTALAAGILLVAGTLATNAMSKLTRGAGDVAHGQTASGDGTEQATAEGSVLTLPFSPPVPSVVAQLGPAPAQPAIVPVGSADPLRAPAVGTTKELVAEVLSPRPIGWKRPESAEASEPNWLAGGRSAMSAIENNRQVLSEVLDFQFNAIPLTAVADWLSQETGTQFDLNTSEIELGGLASPDTPITAAGRATVREILRRVGSTLELTYVVTESTIEITTKDDAGDCPNMRFYDLAYVLPNSENTSALISAIQTSVAPLDWDTAGGRSTISVVGSMMIINAPDTTHHQVEILLLNVVKMNPENAMRATRFPPASPVPAGSGMGEMGGGMF